MMIAKSLPSCERHLNSVVTETGVTGCGAALHKGLGVSGLSRKIVIEIVFFHRII